MSDKHRTTMSIGWFRELVSLITRNIPEKVTHESYKFWMQNGSGMRNLLEKIFDQKVLIDPGWDVTESGVSFEVISNGFTGEQWIEYFEERSYKLNKHIVRLLMGLDFVPTSGIVYRCDIISLKQIKKLYVGHDLDSYVILKNILENKFQNSMEPPLEVGCLTRALMSQDNLATLGFDNIQVMHDPVDNEGSPAIVAISSPRGRDPLDAVSVHPCKWDKDSHILICSRV